MMQVGIRMWLSLIVVLFVTGCNPSEKKEQQPRAIVIKQGDIDGKTYYVPESYFVLKGDGISNGIYVRAMYPEFSPVLDDSRKLWKEKQQYKKIRVLAKRRKSNIDFDDFAKGTIKNLRVYEVVGDEYGLIHRKQPEGYVQDHDDMWLEKSNDNYHSYITCSEKIIKADVPHCKLQVFYKSQFRIKATFNKVLLPHWKIIKSNVLEMFESFENEDTAREYISQKLNVEQEQKQGVK